MLLTITAININDQALGEVGCFSEHPLNWNERGASGVIKKIRKGCGLLNC
jgi:hypothetical protein